MNYFYVGLIIIFLIMGGTIKYLYNDNQILSGQKKSLEAVNAANKKQLEAFTNRPRTNGDVIKRLCDWAYTIDRNKKSHAQCLLPKTTVK